MTSHDSTRTTDGEGTAPAESNPLIDDLTKPHDAGNDEPETHTIDDEGDEGRGSFSHAPG